MINVWLFLSVRFRWVGILYLQAVFLANLGASLAMIIGAHLVTLVISCMYLPKESFAGGKALSMPAMGNMDGSTEFVC